MNRERYNEILGELLKLNETVETTTLLEELRNGFNEPGGNSSELEEANARYKALEQKYIDTFKSNLQATVSKETPIESKIGKEEVNEEVEIKTASFDDIFK